MKRNSLVVGLVAFVTLALHATDASAFFCHRPWRRCNRCTTHITCRPYNAFTPICWGNLVCDGCCPNPCGVASGCLPWQYMGYPPFAAGCGPTCMAGMYPANAGMGYAPAFDAVTPAPMPPAPATTPVAPPTFTPPPPAPANSYYYPGAFNPYAYALNPYGLMRVGYYAPAYYPNYNAGYSYNPALYAAYYQAMYNYYNQRR